MVLMLECNPSPGSSTVPLHLGSPRGEKRREVAPEHEHDEHEHGQMNHLNRCVKVTSEHMSYDYIYKLKLYSLCFVYGKFTNISPIGSKCLKICQHHGACMRRLLIFLYNNMRVWFHVCCIIESKIKHLQHVMHLFDYFSSCLVRLNKAYVLASSWVGYPSHSLAFIDSYLRNDPCARRHWCLQGIITLSSQRWRMLKTRGSRHCTRSLAATCLANGMAKATCLAAS